MEKLSSKEGENFSKADTIRKAIVTGAVLTTAGITTANFLEEKKQRRKEKARLKILDYLSTRINPRTFQIEKSPEILNPMNFAIIPGLLNFIAGTGAIIAGERAFDHYTSVEYRAKKKIDKKYDKAYEKWYNARLEDLKNGKISKADLSLEKDSKKKEFELKAKEEYENWKEREEFIRNSSRDYYNSLQKATPGPDAENFALFKDFIPQKNENNVNIQFPTESLKINPDLSGFIKLDVTKMLLNKGFGVLSNLFFKEDTIKDAVKKMLFIEAKIDSLSLSKEKKEELKFNAFKEVVAKFKNPADIEKFFKLKKVYSDKINKKIKAKGKNVNFENNVLDNTDFSGWKKQEGI